MTYAYKDALYNMLLSLPRKFKIGTIYMNSIHCITDANKHVNMSIEVCTTYMSRVNVLCRWFDICE